MTDYSDLRAKAEAATPGRWAVFENAHNHWGMREVVGSALSIRGFTIGAGIDRQRASSVEADATFIAAACPSVVLAILTEREADKARIAELEALLGHWKDKAAETLTKMQRAEAELAEARSALLDAAHITFAGETEWIERHAAAITKAKESAQ